MSRPAVPWLARSWTYSNGNKTLTLNLAKGVKWSDGKALTSTDVVYSLRAGLQSKAMDLIGLTCLGHVDLIPDPRDAPLVAEGRLQRIASTQDIESLTVQKKIDREPRANKRHRR